VTHGQQRPTGPLGAIVLPVLLHRRGLVMLLAVATLASVAFALLRPRKFDATVTLATVGNPRLGGLSGGLAASVLGGVGLNLGLQPTPAIMARLVTIDGVLLRVGSTPFGDSDLLSAAARKPSAGLAYERRLRAMRKVLSASFDRQTGLVAVRALHRDSAVARLLVTRAVEEASAAFVQGAKAQAAELRDAQSVRVDSAAAQLRAAEQALVVFMRANRDVPPYAMASVELSRLQRSVDLARDVFDQAVGDREAAIAKVLEDTPAVVIMDGLPSALPLRPRFGSLIVAGTVFVTFLVGILAILLWTRFRAHVAAGDPAALLADSILPGGRARGAGAPPSA
jgi:uncharacterized protein involved in exopolysaccharide biosynthesis